jgi:hypothetical protein
MRGFLLDFSLDPEDGDDMFSETSVGFHTLGYVPEDRTF